MKLRSILMLCPAVLGLFFATGCKDEEDEKEPTQACECSCCDEGACPAACGEACDCAGSKPNVGGRDDGGDCPGGSCKPKFYSSRLAMGALGFSALAGCVTPSFNDLSDVRAPVEFAYPNMADEGEVYDSRVHGAGKALVLEFYFNGCPYCVQNHPNVSRLAAAHPGQVLEVGIDCDLELYEDWMDRFPAGGPLLNGCDRVLAQRLGIRSYPSVVVLNAQHEVVLRRVGVWNDRIYQEIDQLLTRGRK